MKRVFADTSYWIALLNPRDELHERAVSAAGEHPAGEIVTSEMVLVELLNGLSAYGPPFRDAAARAVRTLLANRKVWVIPQTSDQFRRALERYQAAADKNWSLTDCASFLIMEAEGIQAALSHDRHFAQAGYQILLR
jgi:uncharacterized protein